MPQRNLVLFDLEWNIGYQPYTFNYHGVQQTFRGEIIEIGAVKIDEDANVLDTFSIHLRPRIFRKLQHHIAKVTGLTQEDLDNGAPIVQGLRRFMQWCGPDAEFAEWGMDDVPVLKQNLFLCNLDESRPTVWYDLQQVFLREHPRKEGESMTLESVVTRMGIPMERPFHDALSDTLYTADICRKLDLRAGIAAYPTEEEALRASLYRWKTPLTAGLLLPAHRGHWASVYQALLPFFSQTSSGVSTAPQQGHWAVAMAGSTRHSAGST